jgi:hypothetical protein
MQAQAGSLQQENSSPRYWKTIIFSGYQWSVRSGEGGPGPNLWSDSNAWVDSNGFLHLKISYVNGAWRCAEVVTKDRLGFGTYQFQIAGRIDQLDPNVVLGLFNYPTPDVGPDTTNEIDIEFSRWGDANYPMGNYTVWPAEEGLNRKSKHFSFSLAKLAKPRSTHKFTWTSTQVKYRSQYGLRNDNLKTFASWLYAPLEYTRYVPQSPMQAHINLWLYQGKPPQNGTQIHLIIRSFKFTPSP